MGVSAGAAAGWVFCSFSMRGIVAQRAQALHQEHAGSTRSAQTQARATLTPTANSSPILPATHLTELFHVKQSSRCAAIRERAYAISLRTHKPSLIEFNNHCDIAMIILYSDHMPLAQNQGGCMLSVVESAEILQVTPTRVRALIAQGALPAQKVGRTWTLREEDVMQRAATRPSAGRPRKADVPSPADDSKPHAAASELYRACKDLSLIHI